VRYQPPKAKRHQDEEGFPAVAPHGAHSFMG
jgi:hypothetical protein